MGLTVKVPVDTDSLLEALERSPPSFPVSRSSLQTSVFGPFQLQNQPRPSSLLHTAPFDPFSHFHLPLTGTSAMTLDLSGQSRDTSPG